MKSKKDKEPKTTQPNSPTRHGVTFGDQFGMRVALIALTIILVLATLWGLLFRLPKISEFRRERMEIVRLQDEVDSLRDIRLPATENKAQELEEEASNLLFDDEFEIQAWISNLIAKVSTPSWEIESTLSPLMTNQLAAQRMPVLLESTNTIATRSVELSFKPIGAWGEAEDRYNAFVAVMRELLDDSKLIWFTKSAITADGRELRSALLSFDVLEGKL